MVQAIVSVREVAQKQPELIRGLTARPVERRPCVRKAAQEQQELPRAPEANKQEIREVSVPRYDLAVMEEQELPVAPTMVPVEVVVRRAQRVMVITVRQQSPQRTVPAVPETRAQEEVPVQRAVAQEGTAMNGLPSVVGPEAEEEEMAQRPEVPAVTTEVEVEVVQPQVPVSKESSSLPTHLPCLRSRIRLYSVRYRQVFPQQA